MYEGPDPERLLIEAWSRHGTSVRISEPTCVRKGGVFGFFAKLHYRIEVQPSEDAEPVDGRRAATAPEEAAQPASAVPAGSPTTTAGALDRLVESTEDLLDLDSSPRPSFDDVLSGVASSLGDDPSRLDVPLVDLSLPEAEGARAGTVGAATAAPPPPAGRLPAGDASLRETLAERLADVGYPVELLARRDFPGEGRSALEAAFAALPAPPPLPAGPGSLVAVVGELGQALAVAGSLAEQMALEDTELALAAPEPPAFAVPDHLLATDPGRARALAPGWRRDAACAVAVACGGAPASPQWTRRMLRALKPTATWAIVSATAKPEDIARRVAALGGVDAIVLVDLDQTVTPVAACRVGVPIARLGRLVAGVEAWADVVDDVLAPPVEAGRRGSVQEHQKERSAVRCQR